jgi:hypothetical protein
MTLLRPSGLLVLTSIAGLLAGCQTVTTTDTASSRAAFERYAVINGEKVAPPDVEMGDPAVIAAILSEGKHNSQVMALLTEMCDTFGSRLTGSTANEAAQLWSKTNFESWGLSNVHLHEWGTIATRFDRGPSTGVVYRAGGDKMRDMEFSTLAWTRGTDGPVRGKAVMMPTSIEEYEANAGSYADAWLLLRPDYSGRRGIRSVGFIMREHQELRDRTRDQLEGVVPPSETKPETVAGQAWSGSMDYNGSGVPVEVTLTRLGEAPEGTMSIPNFHTGPIQDARMEGNTIRFRFNHAMGASQIELTMTGDKATGSSTGASGTVYPLELARVTPPESSREVAFDDPILARVLAENPAGFVSSSKDERVWTTSANGWRERVIDDYPIDLEVNVREGDYDYITARIAMGVPVEVEFDLPHTLTAGPIPVYNVIAEIPGTEFPDEVVIVSAHQDSWDGPGSQGTIDNGTGTAVTMETARILMAAGARPKRTIRFALWSGEEQGLLGARVYANELTEEQRAKISAVFVDDGGTNHQGGIPVADNMVEFLAAATSWTNGHFYSNADGSHMHVNIRPTGPRIETHGGSDHAAFNALGIPGFFWDEIGRSNYSYGWHTQKDRLDLAIEEYLVQSATNSAITAYNLANAPTLLPRAAPPEPAAPQSGGGR